VKRSNYEAPHYATPISAEVRELVDLYLHSPNTPPWCGSQLKHRDNLPYLTLPYLTFTSYMQFNPAFLHVLPFLLKYSPQHPQHLCLRLCSSLSV